VIPAVARFSHVNAVGGCLAIDGPGPLLSMGTTLADCAVSDLSRGCLGAEITLATVSRVTCDMQKRNGFRLQCVQALGQTLAQPPHRLDFELPSVDHSRKSTLLFVRESDRA